MSGHGSLLLSAVLLGRLLPSACGSGRCPRRRPLRWPRRRCPWRPGSPRRAWRSPTGTCPGASAAPCSTVWKMGTLKADALLGAAEARVPMPMGQAPAPRRSGAASSWRGSAAPCSRSCRGTSPAVSPRRRSAARSGRVEVGAARAVVVDDPAVGELGAALVVELGQRPEGGVLQHRAEQVVGVGRAAWDGDDRLALQDVARRPRRRWGSGRGGRDAAPGGAGADGDDRGRRGWPRPSRCRGRSVADRGSRCRRPSPGWRPRRPARTCRRSP